MIVEIRVFKHLVTDWRNSWVEPLGSEEGRGAQGAEGRGDEGREGWVCGVAAAVLMREEGGGMKGKVSE